MSVPLPASITKQVKERMSLAESLFTTLATQTIDPDGRGVTRTSYGEGENFAHRLLTETAEPFGFETKIDFAGNLYMTMPGRDRSLPAVLTGSHLDSVQHGGNFDGAAGVIAGIVAMAALHDLKFQPEQDITLVATRCEESGSWFTGRHGGHIGARSALGLLWPNELDTAFRVDSGKTLGYHMAECGCDVEALKSGKRYLDPKNIKLWIELHIEQGPVLVQRSYPVGIVSGIRGVRAVRSARCIGEWAHAGGTPLEVRKDAVVATLALLNAIDKKSEEVRAGGKDLSITIGKLFTNSQYHSVTKVAGQVDFSLDIRSTSEDVLVDIEPYIKETAQDIERRFGVKFDLGTFDPTPSASMDPRLLQYLQRGTAELDISNLPMPCGASHDTVDFVACGVPAAMIFVRNRNGSHNPDEAMEMDDFYEGARLLCYFLAQRHAL